VVDWAISRRTFRERIWTKKEVWNVEREANPKIGGNVRAGNKWRYGRQRSVSITARYISWLPQASKRSAIQVNIRILTSCPIFRRRLCRDYFCGANLGVVGLYGRWLGG